MTVKGWTQDREARARQLWKEGYSATAIACDLNCGMTRNAVIGKLSRMGLVGAGSSRSSPSAPVKKAVAPSCPDAVPSTAANVSIAASERRGRPAGRLQNARTKSVQACAPSGPSSAAERANGADAPEDECTSPVSVEALRAGQCKWPVTSPAPGEPHLFCGARAISGKPYCVAHYARAYRPKPEHADAAAPGPQGREGKRPPAPMRGTDSADALEDRHK